MASRQRQVLETMAQLNAKKLGIQSFTAGELQAAFWGAGNGAEWYQEDFIVQEF